MKRTIQGLLVTSLLLVGCTSTSGTSFSPEKELTSSISARQLAETRENLKGICTAISRYGLPADDQTRGHVREKVEMLESTADNQPELESIDAGTAIDVLRELGRDYAKCDPEVAREIELALEGTDRT